MIRRKVNGVWFVGETVEAVDALVDCVRRGEPSLGQQMRLKRSRREGMVVMIDREKRTAKLDGITGEHLWRSLEYVH